ncbi:polyamine aminopropyltransferase [Shewanella litorisediminis]|uniref:Polyamine aminopropyltransferase n=1 Tax=Shewanella litorisediminis TaxID=1173586 RepID=A0ABX7G0Z3_9GAMM|nr:polyamine aminopropyltransferase [Shewanella litorisediminis]MCL2918878.1 polyamine aminopropyltransferase [Shewanella litorisediminis]QRH00951.1 polyamine aminopropyltransferase [Shewanella litorisediminis]
MALAQDLPQPLTPAKHLGRLDDALLLGIMALLAGCGLIYEYLLSHYAGRILGAMEAAIYTMIGLMIVAMGAGAFAARAIRNPFAGFALLELTVALLGASSVLFCAAAIGLTQRLPQLLADTFGLPPDLLPTGGFLGQIQQLMQYLPYLVGTLLGLLIGMEIPLIARVRQALSDEHLLHNAGTIYGADYIGAGVGAAIWVGLMLAMDIQLAAALTASVNLLAGLAFILRFRTRLRHFFWLLLGHILASVALLLLAIKGPALEQDFNNLLYKDKVIYSQATRFQQLVFTERLRGTAPPVYSLYLNGRLQFSTQDEAIYHGFLVWPAMMAAARHDRVLIVGGGDGMAARDVLQWQPREVVLMDLDEQLVRLFQSPADDMPTRLANALLRQNAAALQDARLSLMFDDAFNGVDKLIEAGQHFDVVIVDLPDPSHPDLSKLYSDLFYRKLKELLSHDGAIAIQSTSPWHATRAFLSVGNTLESAGFNIARYHQNVPSFGEWGWTLGTLSGSAKDKVMAAEPIPHAWLSKEMITSAFAFPPGFEERAGAVDINQFGSQVIYQYHQEAWQEESGINLF